MEANFISPTGPISTNSRQFFIIIICWLDLPPFLENKCRPFKRSVFYDDLSVVVGTPEAHVNLPRAYILFIIIIYTTANWTRDLWHDISCRSSPTRPTMDKAPRCGGVEATCFLENCKGRALWHDISRQEQSEGSDHTNEYRSPGGFYTCSSRSQSSDCGGVWRVLDSPTSTSLTTRRACCRFADAVLLRALCSELPESILVLRQQHRHEGRPATQDRTTRRTSRRTCSSIVQCYRYRW